MSQSDTGPLPDAFVSLFWGVRVASELELVVDPVRLRQAEAYGDFLTEPRGHYDVWEAWRRLGPAGLVKHGLPSSISWTEYEQWPRGRTVFHIPSQRFVVYADRRLLRDPTFIHCLANGLQMLEGSYDLRTDPHYRTR